MRQGCRLEVSRLNSTTADGDTEHGWAAACGFPDTPLVTSALSRTGSQRGDLVRAAFHAAFPARPIALDLRDRGLAGAAGARPSLPTLAGRGRCRRGRARARGRRHRRGRRCAATARGAVHPARDRSLEGHRPLRPRRAAAAQDDARRGARALPAGDRVHAADVAPGDGVCSDGTLGRTQALGLWVLLLRPASAGALLAARDRRAGTTPRGALPAGRRHRRRPPLEPSSPTLRRQRA